MNTEELKKDYPIYPEIKRQTLADGESIKEVFSSLLRLERNGKWHILLCKVEWRSEGRFPSAQGMKTFLQNVYMTQQLFVIEPNEEKYLDLDQRSEVTRMGNIVDLYN